MSDERINPVAPALESSALRSIPTQVHGLLQITHPDGTQETVGFIGRGTISQAVADVADTPTDTDRG